MDISNLKLVNDHPVDVFPIFPFLTDDVVIIKIVYPVLCKLFSVTIVIVRVFYLIEDSDYHRLSAVYVHYRLTILDSSTLHVEKNNF